MLFLVALLLLPAYKLDTTFTGCAAPPIAITRFSNFASFPASASIERDIGLRNGTAQDAGRAL